MLLILKLEKYKKGGNPCVLSVYWSTSTRAYLDLCLLLECAKYSDEMKIYTARTMHGIPHNKLHKLSKALLLCCGES